MFIDDCTNCKIIIGPCDGSIFIRTSKNCTISVVSKQLRFRDCQNLKIFTYCPSDPVIEASSGIFFAPFNAFFPKLKELFVKAKFVESI
jgi:protein XRP2